MIKGGGDGVAGGSFLKGGASRPSKAAGRMSART
jgi:hypothetical protein